MIGQLVFDVAQLISDTATQRITQCTDAGDDPLLHLRGSLLLALVSNEAERGTSKEELIATLARIYDLINSPSIFPPPIN